MSNDDRERTIFKSSLDVPAKGYARVAASASLGPDGRDAAVRLYFGPDGEPLALVDAVAVGDVLRYMCEHYANVEAGTYAVELRAIRCGRGPGKEPAALVELLTSDDA